MKKPLTKPVCCLVVIPFFQIILFECCFGMELVDKINLLHQEVVKGNDTAVRVLLNDVEADARLVEGGLTPFYRAASAGNRKIMHILLLARADIYTNVTDPAMDLDGAPYSLLKYAVRSGDVTAVENLLAVGVNRSSISGQWRYAPLHEAVERRRYNITRILLESNVSVNADSVNGPALSIAARQGNLDMIKLLLEHGADINGAGMSKPPLIEAVIAGKQDIAQKLIEHGADPNAYSESGDNAIHIAAKNGLNEITKYLIRKGLVNQRNKVGRTALHFVERADTAYILLKNGALVDAVTKQGETPLHYATYKGNFVVALLLVENGARVDLLSNETYGMKEPFEEHKQLIRLLFRNNPKHNGNNTKGFSALAIAIWMGNRKLISFLITRSLSLNIEGLEWPPLHMAAYCGKVEVIQELVEAGAYVNVRDIIGWTPLHKAVLRGSVEGVHCLVRLGAELDAKDQYGRTPLHLAAEYGMLEIVKFLIGSGADPNAKDTAGFNVLAWAVAGGHPYFLRLMMDSVSDLESSERYGYIKTLAKKDIETIMNLTDEYKQYIHRFDEGAVRDFLEKTIQDMHINITDIGRRLSEYANDKDRPFTFENIRGIIETVFQEGRKIHLEMIDFIANKTTDLDEQDSILGWSVLHWAAAVGDLEAVKFFVGKGTSINAENKFEQTPMFLARLWGHKDLYQFFKKSGAVW